MSAPEQAETGVRLDKWLWAARFFKTRQLAVEAIAGGKVQVNGQRVKPGRAVQPGMRISIHKDSLQWDIEVLGIGRQRRPAAEAARACLAHAGWDPDDVDLILLATSSPDDLFGTAPRVQAALGARRAVAFDLTAACSGFLFALITAAQYIRGGTMRRVIVIGADQLSRWVDWDDRRTCVLFGDGAGAVAVEAGPDGADDLLGFRMRSDGSRNACLTLAQTEVHRPLIGELSSQTGGFAPIHMNGQEVYKFAVREVPAVLAEVLEGCGVTAADLDWLLLHQANQRILDAVAERFSVPADRVLSNLAAYGCLLYTSPSPRDATLSRMPSSA